MGEENCILHVLQQVMEVYSCIGDSYLAAENVSEVLNDSLVSEDISVSETVSEKVVRRSALFTVLLSKGTFINFYQDDGWEDEVLWEREAFAILRNQETLRKLEHIPVYNRFIRSQGRNLFRLLL